MTLNFCKKCNALMDFYKDKNKLFFKCDKCKIVEEVKEKDYLFEKEKIRKQKERGEGAVKDENIFATYPHICEKCGYGKAEIIDEGVKYTDEAGVILLECGKCGWAERLDKKTS